MTVRQRPNPKAGSDGEAWESQLIMAKKAAFLAAFAECGTILGAVKAAGVARHTHYVWLKKDEQYKKAFRQACRAAGEMLEQEARRRAIEGVVQLKFHAGQPIIDPRTGQPYVELRYSDILLIFLLKGAMPKKYRERYETNVTLQDLPNTTGPEELEAARRAYNAVFGRAAATSFVGINDGGCRNN